MPSEVRQSALRFTKLGDRLGVAIDGVDLHEPPDRELQERLHQAQLEHLVIVIRGQTIDAAQFRDALVCFGEPHLDQTAPLHPDYPEVKLFSPGETKIQADQRLVFGALWHTDGAYMAAPCSLTALYGLEIPSTGGDTQFSNLYAAYDDLPAATKQRIAKLRLSHNMISGRNQATPRSKDVADEIAKAWPPVVHPLVRVHPETGRKLLYICGERMEYIIGMERGESEELLQELLAHATQPKYQYRHKWTKGDIVIWDNRCLVHKANGDYPFGERRFLYRITLKGAVPIAA